MTQPTHPDHSSNTSSISTLDELAQSADYSLMAALNADPDATSDGQDHRARQVLSGHYVPVTPTPIAHPEYVSHSQRFFNELGINDALAVNNDFTKIFSGDLSSAPAPMTPYGWATGYALSIYGTEYTQQCPFGTGNGYGDGRAMSIFEGIFKGKRWEMQLKGGGPTPYCRGADGRAVLRSSVREFLAQEYMHALGVPTARSLTLYVSKSETVSRPWYAQGSYSENPDVWVDNPVAISTRVAPSFLRVGQIELFARRARNKAHPEALEELKKIVMHLIEREYKQEIDQTHPFNTQIIELATHFRQRLTALVANWLRVGFCQGNFNSDNCPAGGFTLDYGPFGFCEAFATDFQPWTGGGKHFSFFNQPAAAEANFHMFYTALQPLLLNDKDAMSQLDALRHGFRAVMQQQTHNMWASKLGMTEFNAELFAQLMQLMIKTQVDYTLFFRALSHIPKDIAPLKKSFYQPSSEELDQQWQAWLNAWQAELACEQDDLSAIAIKMKQTNPKYTWREWLVVPAYQQAEKGDYSLINTLKSVFNDPYSEQSTDVEAQYCRLKPQAFFNAGGISQYSCSS